MGTPNVLPAPESYGRLPFRLRIGAVGHRHLLDEQRCRRNVREALESLRDDLGKHRHTAIRFTVLSALAEGADRLIVEEARACLADVELHVVLPLREDLYLTDFHTRGSRLQFEHLLRLAVARSEINDTTDRDVAYERAARFIIDSSDIVVALWDGRPSTRGGTGETMRYAREHDACTYLLPARRAGQPGEAPIVVPQRPPRLSAMARESLARFDEYNAQRNQSFAVLVAAADRRIDEGNASSTVQLEYEDICRWAVPYMARAELLAARYQRLQRRAATTIYALAALAVCIVAAKASFSLSNKWLFGEVLAMLLLMATYGLARRHRYNERWQGYRSLAESLRSSMFSALTGGPAAAALERPRASGVHERWHQRAFAEAWRGRPDKRRGEIALGELRRILRTEWLEGQIDYHRATADVCRARRSRLTVPVLLLFGATFLLALAHALELADSKDASRWLQFFAIAFPAIGTALVGLRDQRQYRLHEERSLQTVERLHRLDDSLDTKTRLAALQHAVEEASSILDAENLDWAGVVELQDVEVVL